MSLDPQPVLARFRHASFLSISIAALALPWAYACSGEVEGAHQLGSTQQDIDLTPGFQHEVIATGFRNPTAMTIAPDGRVFIAQQTGEVRVVKNGVLLAQNLLAVQVDSGNERGLVGIALDPQFASNGYLYVFYTVPGGSAHNRVSRFTVQGDVAAAGSEQVLVDFPALSSASNHNSGALHFGPDGKLYVAHGDNAEERNAQNLDMPFGKILRFNRDGTVPADNPFYESPVDVADAIWAYGLRNPFTMGFSPRSGRLFANDVGGGGPEEINDIVRAANYGHGGGPAPLGPVYSYPRVGKCAITGGTFYEPGVLNFPSSYVGKYFFADYCAGEIWFMNQDGTGVTSFARSRDGHLNNPVDLDVGLDGSLYYLQRGNGEKLSRIFVPQANCTRDAECSDQNACNGAETCVANQCRSGSALLCDDGDACTSNTCNPASGCSYPANGLCNCTQDGECNDMSTCTDDRCVNRMCQHTQNGSCGESPLTLKYLGGGDGFGASVAGLTDGNLEAKVASAVTPSCLEYELGGSFTVSSARLMEDNAGNWRVDSWKVQTDDGRGYRDALPYSDSPNAMPSWNSLSFSAVSGVKRVKVCLESASGMLEAAELQVLGRVSGGGAVCGDQLCNGSETCTSCASDCGPCAPVCGDRACGGGETCASCPGDCGSCASGPISLTHISDGGGFDNVAGLTDGNLTVKVASGISPNCLVYSLPGPHTLRSARLLEDNDGSWHVDTWRLRYDDGAGFKLAFDYTDTPHAMPSWNEVDLGDVSGATRVELCVQNNGAIEAAELQLIGEPSAAGACGDRVCSASESCTSCPWDCGRCASTTVGLDTRPRNSECVAGSASAAPPALLSEHPCVALVDSPPEFVSGVLPFDINLPFWSDGAEKSRYLAIPDGTTLTVSADGDLTLPPGGVTIKNFAWQGSYFETRFFVRYQDNSYGAHSYRWNDAQTEATLVDPELGAEKALPGGPLWRYPTRTQCFECHHEANGFSLGLEARQLNRDLLYVQSGRSANQFRTLLALGMLSGQTSERAPLPAPGDSAASLEARARAYLHVNCGTCHRPGGPGYGLADYRYDTPWASARACNEPSILAAYPGYDLVEPGDHARSVVWLRAQTRGENQMPPLASTVVDSAGTSLLSGWIDALSGCP